MTGRGLSPDDVLPLPDPQTKASADARAALMQSRRSARRFSDREVDAALVERIVALAATATMGIPPWDVGCLTFVSAEQIPPEASPGQRASVTARAP